MIFSADNHVLVKLLRQ